VSPCLLPPNDSCSWRYRSSHQLQLLYHPSHCPTGTPLTSTAGWLTFVTNQHRQPAPRFNLGSTVRVPRPVIANRSSSPIVYCLGSCAFQPSKTEIPAGRVPGGACTVDPGHSLTETLPTRLAPYINPNSWAATSIWSFETQATKAYSSKALMCYCKTIPSHLICVETAVIQEPKVSYSCRLDCELPISAILDTDRPRSPFFGPWIQPYRHTSHSGPRP
jgi:hypothetical protein